MSADDMLLQDATPLRWIDRAVCLGTDPDVFFPDQTGDNGAMAKRICAVCPVRSECLDYALEHNERDGWWGGLGPDERRVIRRTRRQA